jgi:hypothetical protein
LATNRVKFAPDMKTESILTCLIFMLKSMAYANKHIPSDDQLWSFDSSTKKLSNKDGSWLLMDKTWEIPTNGTAGYITDILSGQVLTLKDGNDEYETEVQLQDKKSPITSFTNYTEDQKWYRKWWNAFDSDYFVLIGGQSQRLLTAEGTEKLFISVSKEFKDDGGSDILKYLRLIISGAVMGLLAIIIPSIWIYCLCCREKARMTLPERDQFQKDKWQSLNAYQRI